MAHKLIKIGKLDNQVTYDHVCDTMADRAKIPPEEINLGSTVMVLEGESGGVEVYMAKSDKTWKFLASIGGGESDEEEEQQEEP